MPAEHQGLLRLFIACALPLLAMQSAVAANWATGKKVVELSRYGIRPPAPGNRELLKPATQRPWTEWTTRWELTRTWLCGGRQ